MLRRIGAPRPPPLRTFKQCGWRGASTFDVGDGPQQSNVCGGKGIGFSKLTHRDVLSGPLSDPRKRLELPNRIFKAATGAENARVARDRAGKS